MRLRTITEAELGRLLACVTDDPVGVIDPELLRWRFAAGQYRPGLTWIAENRGRIMARAVWWLPPGGAYPGALDCLLVDDSVSDRASLAVSLLGVAHDEFLDRGMSVLPAYHIFLPTGWRNRPDVVAALQWRQQAAQRTGLTRELERLRFGWTPAAGLPARRGASNSGPSPTTKRSWRHS